MITVPEANQVDAADEGPLNDPKEPPYRMAGTVLLLIVALVFGMTWALFRGYFDSGVTVVVMAERAGLSMDPGSKVTFNGVPIGRLKSAGVVTDGRGARARLVLDVKPQFCRSFRPTWMRNGGRQRCSATSTYRFCPRRIRPRTGCGRTR